MRAVEIRAVEKSIDNFIIAACSKVHTMYALKINSFPNQHKHVSFPKHVSFRCLD
jgi:hypothetical protein